MAARATRTRRMEASAPHSGSAPLSNLPSVTLIGFGNLGTSLAIALHQAGVRIEEIVVRRESKTNTPANRKLVHAVGTKLVTLERAALDADILWICTPDAGIAQAAMDIAKEIRRKISMARVVPPLRSARNRPAQTAASRQARRVVFHSSGALDSGELAAMTSAGASVASVHPLMTFPRRTLVGFPRGSRPETADVFPLAGVPFALQGDAMACRVARRLVRSLHGAPFRLRAKDKPLYHALGAFASPLLIALLTAAEETGAAAGLNAKHVRRLMRPIVERTISNFFTDGPDKSFSGPLARGDAETIARHLTALRRHAPLADVYRQLGLYALAALPAANESQLRRLLSRPARKPASSGRSPASTA